MLRIFLEIVSREQRREKYANRILGKEGKRILIREFKARSGHDFCWNKFKNKYDYERSRFTTYIKLRNRTGVTVIPNTGEIDMPDEWWKQRKRDTPKSQAIKKKPLQCIELMHQVFGRRRVDTELAFSPALTRQRSQATVTNDDSDETEPPTQEVENDEQPDSLENDDGFQNRLELDASPLARREQRSVRNQRRRTRDPTPRRTEIENCIRRLEETNTRRNTIPLVQEATHALVDACTEIGLTSGNAFFVAALRLLGNSTAATQFLALPNNLLKIAMLEGMTGYSREGHWIGLQGSLFSGDNRSSAHVTMGGYVDPYGGYPNGTTNAHGMHFGVNSNVEERLGTNQRNRTETTSQAFGGFTSLLTHGVGSSSLDF